MSATARSLSGPRTSVTGRWCRGASHRAPGRRQEQQTDAFKARMKQRNAIEGTQSELCGDMAAAGALAGLRRARSGFGHAGGAWPKRACQNYFIGAACNVKRWIRRRRGSCGRRPWPWPGSGFARRGGRGGDAGVLKPQGGIPPPHRRSRSSRAARSGQRLGFIDHRQASW